jgi:hypothetical protein
MKRRIVFLLQFFVGFKVRLSRFAVRLSRFAASLSFRLAAEG